MPAPLTQQSGSNVGAYNEAVEGGDGLSLTRMSSIVNLHHNPDVRRHVPLRRRLHLNLVRAKLSSASSPRLDLVAG